MRVLFLAGREEEYTRNQVLLRAFHRFATVTTITDHDPGKSILLRSIQIFLRAVPSLLRGNYDLIFVGFYGHLLILLIRLLARRPILFDAFVSTYDTLIDDRQVASSKSLTAFFSYALDWLACRSASHILVDTSLQIDYFCSTFHLLPDRFTSLPVGCNEDIFFPVPQETRKQTTRILYYCTYLPLHGVDIVVRAAEQVAHEPISFRLIGTGPEYSRIQKLVKTLGLQNIEFLPPVTLQTLAREIAESNICLGGHFGTSKKAGRVIPGKIYQILACGRPVIATDTPANISLLTHACNAYICQPGDAQSLASAVLELCRNDEMSNSLGKNGRILYEKTCSEAAITESLEKVTQQLTGKRQGSI